jgi:hypothetical protein
MEALSESLFACMSTSLLSTSLSAGVFSGADLLFFFGFVSDMFASLVRFVLPVLVLQRHCKSLEDIHIEIVIQWVHDDNVMSDTYCVCVAGEGPCLHQNSHIIVTYIFLGLHSHYFTDFRLKGLDVREVASQQK